MKNFKRSVKIVLSALFLTLSSQVQADYDYANSGEECFLPSSWCISKVFVKGDLLYLRAFQEGLSNPWDATLTLEDSESSSCPETTMIGESKSPHFKWDLGYRIGAGIELQDCNWRIAAFWTHFSPDHGKRSCNTSSWKLDYDTIDVLIGYRCEFNSCFKLDSFGGLRAARIDQKLHGRLINRTIHASEGSERESDTITILTRKGKHDFEGIGCLFGLAGEFDLGCGFKAYIEGDAGTLVGHNRVKSFISKEFESCELDIFAYRHHHKAAPYFVESTIGIQWETCLCNGINLAVDLGYESHNYLDLGRIVERGNLYIQGGKFGLALQF